MDGPTRKWPNGGMEKLWTGWGNFQRYNDDKTNSLMGLLLALSNCAASWPLSADLVTCQLCWCLVCAKLGGNFIKLRTTIINNLFALSSGNWAPSKESPVRPIETIIDRLHTTSHERFRVLQFRWTWLVLLDSNLEAELSNWGTISERNQ